MQFSFYITLFAAFFITGSCSKNNGGDSVAETPKTPITADLAGKKWLSTNDWNISTDPNYYTLTVYNPSKKQWFSGERDPWDMRPRPANGVFFTPDGDFEICRFTDFRTGGLRSYTFWYMKGTAAQKGNAITISPQTHQTTYYSTSDPDLNYDKALEHTATTITYAINDAGNGWQELTIKWSDNTCSYFYAITNN